MDKVEKLARMLGEAELAYDRHAAADGISRPDIMRWDWIAQWLHDNGVEEVLEYGMRDFSRTV